jgi:hypothetical protein
MKKIILSLLVVVLVSFTSCKKEVNTDNKYVQAIAGVFSAQDNDLKASPIGADRMWEVYKKVGTAFSPVDGSEFIPNSSAYLDWKEDHFPKTYPCNSVVRIDYCPVMPLRIVTKTRLDDQNHSVAYLGILDFLPNKDNFPVTIVGRRLGDILTVNIDDLKATPGYDFDVTLEYTTGTIDVDATAMGTSNTTNDWPVLLYKKDGDANFHSYAVHGTGNVTVYDGVDKKIIGTIKIKITDPGNRINIVKTVDAMGLGKGLALTLKTDKAGWYDTAGISITDKDIIVEQKEVNIDDGQVAMEHGH